MTDPSSPATSGNLLDRVSDVTGRLISWLTLAMVIVTFVIVVMRYVFDAGLIWLQESVTWMHAVVFMLGASYTMLHEEHVRVDIFYRAMSELRRAWIDLLGVIIFLLPLCGFLTWTAYGFAITSWAIHESSREPGGLAYPMIPILKSVVLIMPVALSLQGLSLAMRALAMIRRS